MGPADLSPVLPLPHTPSNKVSVWKHEASPRSDYSIVLVTFTSAASFTGCYSFSLSSRSDVRLLLVLSSPVSFFLRSSVALVGINTALLVEWQLSFWLVSRQKLLAWFVTGADDIKCDFYHAPVPVTLSRRSLSYERRWGRFCTDIKVLWRQWKLAWEPL